MCFDLLVVVSLGLDSELVELGELLEQPLVEGLPGLLVRGSYKLMLLSTLAPPGAPTPTLHEAPPDESSLGSYGAMEGGDELDGVDDEVEETENGAGSDGCFSADFCGCRRGSKAPLRATRGSTGFSAGKGGGAVPRADTGPVGVGRGGDGVWDGLELTVFRIRDSNSKSGRDELEEAGAGASMETGGCTGGGCE